MKKFNVSNSVKRNFGLAVLAATVMAGSTHVVAATTGNSNLSLIRTDAVAISGVGDIALGEYASREAGLPIIGADTVCVFSSGITYQITFDQTGNAFKLFQNVGTDEMPYSVTYVAVGGGVVNTASPGVPIAGLVGNILAEDCAGIDNGTFAVQVEAADFNAVSPGTYSAVLELTVDAE